MFIEGLIFVCTCGACPEQYDVKDRFGNTLATVRLRWGNLTAECVACGLLYDADYGGDYTDCFADQADRMKYLTEIARAINSHLGKED